MVSVFRIFTLLVVSSVLYGYFYNPEQILSSIFERLIQIVNEFFNPILALLVLLMAILLLTIKQVYKIVLKVFFSLFSAVFAIIGGVIVFEIAALGLILLFFGALLALIADGM
ncbi:hypothetical protein Ferp_1326 [Ferroglobus placidus DSM 10642]|uniref:Uncharacterized protein n=1 Tax=Ferroglobus placidus (strain DSM 10642 / AEDII12DO) TaxID=589924 RepID=D3RYB5_FERPA|nr:hypothetical protein [Ferroglobus placidus]ADC65478.1 hypothetical protein Ferp_1326 [Ferroglobus placidus DSM 10642]